MALFLALLPSCSLVDGFDMSEGNVLALLGEHDQPFLKHIGSLHVHLFARISAVVILKGRAVLVFFALI